MKTCFMLAMSLFQTSFHSQPLNASNALVQDLILYCENHDSYKTIACICN